MDEGGMSYLSTRLERSEQHFRRSCIPEICIFLFGYNFVTAFMTFKEGSCDLSMKYHRFISIL